MIHTQLKQCWVQKVNIMPKNSSFLPSPINTGYAQTKGPGAQRVRKEKTNGNLTMTVIQVQAFPPPITVWVTSGKSAIFPGPRIAQLDRNIKVAFNTQYLYSL